MPKTIITTPSIFKARPAAMNNLTQVNTQPRISANQLGEFTFSTPERKKAIVRDHMFGNPHTAP
jgi:hypothetical protein